MPQLKDPNNKESLVDSMNNLNIGVVSEKDLTTVQVEHVPSFVPNHFDLTEGEQSDDDNLDDDTESCNENQDDESVAIVGLGKLELDDSDDDEEEEGQLTAKGGPSKNNKENKERICPYSRPAPRQPEANNFSALDPLQNSPTSFENQLGSGAQFESLTSLLGIPGLPFEETKTVNPQKLLLDTIDNVFGSEEKSNSRIGLKDLSAPTGYTFLPTFLSLEIDEQNSRIGIQLPRMSIPSQCRPNITRGNEGEIGILVQLDMNFNRVVKVAAKAKKFQDSTGNSTWILEKQFLQLNPFSDGSSGLEKLLDIVPPSVMEEAVSCVNRLSFQELVKPIGPNKESWLILQCCKPDIPENRAAIVAIVKKLLSSPDPSVRRSILRPSQDGFTPLIYACLTNKSEVVRFLTEVYYDMGEDITKSNSPKYTLLDMLVRKGDAVADTVEILLQLKYQNGRKVFDSQTKNKKGEIFIHLAARMEKCQHRIIQLLQRDFNACMTSTTDEDMLPIHYACQYSRDPALLALLLFYDCTVINAQRKDGFSPLHIVAARSEGKISSHSPSGNLVPLDEDVQCRMIKLLLENGADKAQGNLGYLPVHLVNKNRNATKALLKIPRSRRNSPNNSYKVQQQRVQTEQVSPAASVDSSEFGFTGDESPPDSAATPALPFLFPQPSPFGNGSLTSGNDSDSDGAGSSEEQLDAIAEILIHHPVMQDVMENIFPH